jgi:hypothetical protein
LAQVSHLNVFVFPVRPSRDEMATFVDPHFGHIVEVRLQSVHDVTRFGVVVPEHAEVADADGCHEGTDHLVELARGGTEDAPEGWVAHVEEGLYSRLDSRVSSGVTFSLALRQRSSISPCYSEADCPNAKRDVSGKNSS